MDRTAIPRWLILEPLMNDGIRVALMCRNLPACRKKIDTRELIEHSVAQHLAQSPGPDLRRVLGITSTRLGTSGGGKNFVHTLAFQRDGFDNLGLRPMRQPKGHLNLALELFRARKIGFVDDEH